MVGMLGWKTERNVIADVWIPLWPFRERDFRITMACHPWRGGWRLERRWLGYRGLDTMGSLEVGVVDSGGYLSLDFKLFLLQAPSHLFDRTNMELPMLNLVKLPMISSPTQRCTLFSTIWSAQHLYLIILFVQTCSCKRLLPRSKQVVNGVNCSRYSIWCY